MPETKPAERWASTRFGGGERHAGSKGASAQGTRRNIGPKDGW
jgi:hypothetical protein